MKILVVNGSPRGAHGNTHVLVEAFLEGARAEGGEAKTVFLHQKKIEHCLGCITCWTKHPGVCGRKDDMAELLPLVTEADLLILASPLYFYTVTGLMKNFMDRLLPLALPFFDVKDGKSSHPWRFARKDGSLQRVLLISNSGFPEQVHFAGMKETMRLVGSDGMSLAGLICCAGGVMLQTPLRPQLEWYLEAMRAAGREVVRDGRVSAETAVILERPVMDDSEKFAEIVNANWASIGLVRECSEAG